MFMQSKSKYKRILIYLELISVNQLMKQNSSCQCNVNIFISQFWDFIHFCELSIVTFTTHLLMMTSKLICPCLRKHFHCNKLTRDWFWIEWFVNKTLKVKSVSDLKCESVPKCNFHAWSLCVCLRNKTVFLVPLMPDLPLKINDKFTGIFFESLSRIRLVESMLASFCKHHTTTNKRTRSRRFAIKLEIPPLSMIGKL